MKVLGSRMKMKSLIRRVVGCVVIRALSKGKSIVAQILTKHQKSNKKMSFRMHYNWCSTSSHVMPVPTPLMLSTADDYAYESSPPSQLSGYLRWLEEKGNGAENEIDKLADMFIADSHHKFMLEKAESHRRFQDMLARSV